MAPPGLDRISGGALTGTATRTFALMSPACSIGVSQRYPRRGRVSIKRAGTLGQQRQHLTRLILQLDALTLFVNFSSSQIQLKLIKAPEVWGMGQVWQGRDRCRSITRSGSERRHVRIRANPFKPRDLQVDAQLTPRRCAVN